MSVDEGAVNVVLQVFSGRPDPSWALDSEELGAVTERVAAARRSKSSEEPPPPVLGYRGFRVENRAGVEELPEALSVWRGVIVASDPRRGVETWADVAGLEGWLLEDARRRGHGELLAAAGVRD
jgi:hypothetical protein